MFLDSALERARIYPERQCMLKTRFVSAILVASFMTFLFAAIAFAAIAGTFGDMVDVSPPDSVKPGDSESDSDILVFVERQGVELAEDLTAGITEPGTYRRLRDLTVGNVPAGTVVNSYLIHSDPVGSPRWPKVYKGSVEFEEEILGIIVTVIGLDRTDDDLGAVGTEYPDASLLRGVELLWGLRDKVVWDGNTVEVRFKTSRSYTDQIRVITAGDEEPDTSFGLVGHWTFDDGTGTNAADNAGDNDGTLMNMTEDDWVDGAINGALEFDGVDDYVDIGNRPEFELPVYSWSLWINAPDGPQDTDSTISQPMSNGDEEFILTWDHKLSQFVGAAGHKVGDEWVSAQITSPILPNNWYHVAATYDGSDLSIYLNGEHQDTATVGGPNASDLSLTIGSGILPEGAASFFEGKIDDVRIYDHALDAETIAALNDLCCTWFP